MTGILDRIRNTTVADLENVSPDLSELTSTYRPRVAREMSRIVEGADDLKVSRPAPKNPGMVALRAEDQRIDTRPYAGLPTEWQSEFIASLLEQLRELDNTGQYWEAAWEYTQGMTDRRLWNPARGENVSVWIGRLKAKIAELKATPKGVSSPMYQFADVPDGYYAVNTDGTLKFYRFRTSRSNGRRYLNVQASDEFHPIHKIFTRTLVLETIRTMSPQTSMELYGQHIGRCGRCGRTLTDAESRARGIGPDCWEKM